METTPLAGTMPGEQQQQQPLTKAWPLSHMRLLYMLSRFAMYPSSTDDDEKWLRNLPLLVLVYEAIANGILQYDYSPVCISIVKNGRSRRIWMNISQDARAAIDDLREHGLINALKTCSEDFQPSTAYQITPQATTLLETALSVSEKKTIDGFLSRTTSSKHELRPSKSGMIIFDSGLLKIGFDVDDGKFRFVRCDGSIAESKVTEVESVSYVSSPYLPSCLLHHDTAFSSNAAQAHKCLQGRGSIPSRLSVAIVLSRVRVMVGEWIPCGRNQIVTLNDRLGSLERCQGGLFTSELDSTPATMLLHLSPKLTKIAIVDFEFDSFTNLEADIRDAPNEESNGVVQIESFGMHMHGDGTVIDGMFVEAIMDNGAEAVYVDHLSRLLVDVDLDSSKIINDLLSPHQRALMDMLFMNDARSRNKFSLITAEEVQPKLTADEYLDRGERENELKQVLGEIHCAYDLSDDDKIIIGREGMLLLGPTANQHEPLLVAHLALMSRELFIRFFFKRTFILGDMLNQASAYLKDFEKNPEALAGMRKKINRCSHDIILLEEILELLRDSLHSLVLPKSPVDSGGRRLYDQLQLQKTHNDLAIRCKDLAKLLRGFRAKLKQVQSQNGNMAKTVLEAIMHTVERNVSVIAETTGQEERNMASSFDILLALFTAFLGFEIVDRITDGKLLGIDAATLPGLKWTHGHLLTTLVDLPGVLFVLDMAWATFITLGVAGFTAVVVRRLTKTQTMCFTVNERVNVTALEGVLQGKTVESRTSHFSSDSKIVTVICLEKPREVMLAWKKRRLVWNLGPTPRILVTFDLVNRFLLSIKFQGPIGQDAKGSYEDLMDQFRSAACFDTEYVPPMLGKKQNRRATSKKDLMMQMRTRGRGTIVPTQ